MVVFGKYHYRIFSNRTSVPKMTEETRNDVGVEECKSFTSPNVSTTSASTTRLHLGSLDLNTRAPDTSTATPSRRRLTESQRSANLATKRARYAQKTEGQRLHDAHERRTRRARQQQQANANAAAAAAAALQTRHEEKTRRARNYNDVVRCTKLLIGELIVYLFVWKINLNASTYFEPPPVRLKKCRNYHVARPLFDALMRLCFGYTVANAVAAEAAQMTARARRALQLLGQTKIGCKKCTRRYRM